MKKIEPELVVIVCVAMLCMTVATIAQIIANALRAGGCA